jgi:hypothetical protein
VLEPLDEEVVPDDPPEPLDDDVELPLEDPELVEEPDPDDEVLVPDRDPDDPPLDDPLFVNTGDGPPLHPVSPPTLKHTHATHTATAEPRIAVLLPRKWGHDGPGRAAGSRSMDVSISFCDTAVFR